jgi:mannose/fructose/N-acetylgalactosamine-specific phosphotransferase system component IIC
MMVLELLPVALLGGLLGLDVVSFPQAMLSRPLVAATLAGAFVGRPIEGLLTGVVLELIALETLPFGASRYPEWGSASVVGGAIFADFGETAAGALAVAVLGARATAWVGGWTMVVLRRANAVWATRRREALAAGSYRAVAGLQLLGMTADLVRGVLLTLVALLLLGPLSQAIVSLWSVDVRISRAVVVGLAGTVAAGAAWKIFHTTRGARWYFLGGAVLALAAVLVL